MKRKQQLVSPGKEEATKVPKIDWAICFICQEDQSEKLRCPLNSKSGNPQESYSILAERIKKYKCLKGYINTYKGRKSRISPP